MAFNIAQYLASRELFSVRPLTQAMIKLPFRSGLLGRLGLFKTENLPGTIATFNRYEQSIQLIAPQNRGSAGQAFNLAVKKALPVEVLQYHTYAQLAQTDVDNLINLQTQQLDSLLELTARSIQEAVDSSIEPTLERIRIDLLLYGELRDPLGATIINWKTQFGGYNAVTDIEAADITTANIDSWVNNIQVAMGGVPYSGIIAICGSEVWQALITSAEFKDAYKYTNGAVVQGDMWKVVSPGITDTSTLADINAINYQGVVFCKYPQFVFGTAGPFPATSMVLLPTGVQAKLLEEYGISDFIDSREAGERAQKYYVKQAPADLDRGIRFAVQTNCIFGDQMPESTFVFNLIP